MVLKSKACLFIVSPSEFDIILLELERQLTYLDLVVVAPLVNVELLQMVYVLKPKEEFI